MIKEILVDDERYKFSLFEEFNIWRCLESKKLLSGFEVDLEIELNNIEKFDWNDIAKFISFLKQNANLKIRNIESSKKVLLCYYFEIFKESKIDFNVIDFELLSINYKGLCKNVNLSNQFEYELIFKPINKMNPYEDMGSFNWCSNFRNNLFLGVYCDRF